ncbi:hypothetical protein NBRC10512_007077 [Rhodotorula toruloides]|uniref:RHTO0S16e03598g1_1 n=2 Tax=Rhodotorula toruloides TaxID=5286 RepID=A0A061BDZ8_RHOTO|nr:uncharacterized protein RHTO_02314 [Rhodotorula toruloides NP11]EMS20892.1 hypothetical protein RHTO_02314 [Rhodotorula toruloides NP11]CDR48209.1 RHTO0S16e03598g1_1 [Rhodotorula toruloides]
MDKLPHELLSVILTTAAATIPLARTKDSADEPSSSPRPRTTWLANLSLVSRRFHTVVQSIMFDNIAVTTEKQLRLLAAHLEQNPSLAAKPISLVIRATDSAQSKHAAKAWRKAILRFGRCRPNVRRLEVYGRDDREKFGYFDLSWLESIQSSLEELIVSHIWFAHHESLDNLRLTALRRFTAADYWYDSPPPPHDPFDSRPPRVYRQVGIPKFRRFLRCMPAIESLELLDNDEDAPAVHDMSLEEGPPTLPDITSLTVEAEALTTLLRKQHPHALSPFLLGGSTIQHLTTLYTSGPPLHLATREYNLFERLFYGLPPLRSLTFVNMAASHMRDFDQRMRKLLEQAQAEGYALDLEFRVVSPEMWVPEWDDLARDGWTTPKCHPGQTPRERLLVYCGPREA